MPDQVGATHDNGQPAYWIDANNGKPYKFKMVNGREDRSQKLYLPPAALDPYSTDKGGQEGNGLLKGHAEWNSGKGEWERPTNWGNIAALGVGGAIAAPFAVGALAGAGGASAGGGGLGSASLAGGGLSAAVPGAGMASGLGAAGGTGLASTSLAGLGGLSSAVPGASLASGVGSAAGAGGLASSGLGGSGLSSAVPGSGFTSGVGGSGGGGSLLGTLSKASKFGDLADMATQGAGAQAQGRRADSQADANAADSNNRARANIAAFNLNAPAARANQVARGDVLQTMQNGGPTGDPRIDKFGGGGLRPSAFGTDSRLAGQDMKRQALLALMNNSDQITPQLTTPQKAGTGENLLAGVGMGMNVASGLSAAGKLGKYGKFF